MSLGNKRPHEKIKEYKQTSPCAMRARARVSVCVCVCGNGRIILKLHARGTKCPKTSIPGTIADGLRVARARAREIHDRTTVRLLYYCAVDLRGTAADCHHHGVFVFFAVIRNNSTRIAYASGTCMHACMLLACRLTEGRF